MKKFLVMLVMLVGVFAMTGCGSSSLVGNIIKDEGSLVKIMDEFKNQLHAEPREFLEILHGYRPSLCDLSRQSGKALQGS